MSIRVNIRHLEEHALELEGQSSVHDLDLQSRDELLRFGPPVAYDLRVEKVEQGLLVQGTVSVDIECDCVRCLKAFSRSIVLADWTLHVPLTGAEAAPVEGDCVDLTPFLREDILLALPQHPLCSDDCQGLLREYGRKTAKPSGGESRGEAQSSPWAELDKLDL
jgi:uncharacterized protein